MVLSSAVVLKLWATTQPWVMEGQKIHHAKVIQIRQKDFLQDKNIYNLQNLLLSLIKSFNSTITEILHHTHLVRLHLDKIGLLHHRSFFKSF